MATMLASTCCCPVCGASASSSALSSSRSCPIQPRWSDDDAMAYIFSEGCKTNEEDMDKVQFWTKAIDHYVTARSMGGSQNSSDVSAACHLDSSSNTNQLLITKRQLSHDLERKGTRPLLGGVLAVIEHHGDIVAVDFLMRTAADVSSASGRSSGKVLAISGWVLHNMLVRPAKAAWSLAWGGAGKLGEECGEDEVTPDKEFAPVGNLKQLASVIVEFCRSKRPDECVCLLVPEQQERQHQSSEGLGSLASSMYTFRSIAADAAACALGGRYAKVLSSLSNTDVEVLVAFMVLNDQAVRDGPIVRVVTGRQGDSQAQSAVKMQRTALLSDADKDILFLKCTAERSRAMCKKLAFQVTESRRAALQSRKDGQTPVALVHLRRSKSLERALGQRLEGLLSLENVLQKLEALQLDKEILKAHETATALLKNYRLEHGFSVDKVDDVIDALNEEMQEVDDISRALAEIGDAAMKASGLNVNEADLEKELDALMADDGKLSDTLAKQQQPLEQKPDIAMAANSLSFQAVSVDANGDVSAALEKLNLNDKDNRSSKEPARVAALGLS